jgi:hypothetical protein
VGQRMVGLTIKAAKRRQQKEKENRKGGLM